MSLGRQQSRRILSSPPSQKYPGNSHISATKPGNNPKTGRIDSAQLIIKKRPIRKGRRQRHSWKPNYSARLTTKRKDKHRREGNRPYTRFPRHGASTLRRQIPTTSGFETQWGLTLRVFTVSGFNYGRARG